MRRIALGIIWFYQKFISKYILTGSHCRFTPTCSEYAKQAFTKYGFMKALYLTIRRVGKCHPFHEGGYDPLP
ncbi:MAG: membrane protein insertion efficiency factor YidD [Ezakiella coagulans]|uniref:membrane protein insertion efficiency factor YidD n=1 Tax=Ezakiella coagulans TaxID=46507 RepID=UPI002014CCCF|nr:membrane protein insertion efficiency factor YidD [Ezakiella coagulans]UQK60167.1 membrane protein insertion efficiency factor YidD [Ezakiella coagulans]